MSGISVLVWVWLGLVSRALSEHMPSTNTTTVLSQGDQIMDTLQKIQSALKSKQTGHSGAVCEASTEFLALKNSLSILEMKQKEMETNQKVPETSQKAMERKLSAMETKLSVMESKLEAAETALVRSNRKAGSTFVRWGRKSCTSNSQLVYSGVAGGSIFNHSGAAANPLCLTLAPEFDGTAPHPTLRGYLYGAEYERIPYHHDHDVPCSVCRAALPTTIMIPATRTCPTGWTTQYTGYLTSGHHGFSAASEYVCLDKDLENASSGHQNHNGYLFYYTVTQCGSLPCPPYINNRVVLCVVCSK